MTRWLIDGMNVIGSRPDGWWRDRDAAVRRLVGELAAFAVEAGDEVIVVFDGHPVELDHDPGPVDVRFATRSGRNAADDDIAQLAGADHALTVVTSDADLAARVGNEVVGAGSFRSRLDR
jgi:predicted RNA-binding protein with PIN domain